MTSLGIGVSHLRRSPRWSRLAALFAEWRRRIRSRYELERLSERDTPLDAANEMQKPFWEA